MTFPDLPGCVSGGGSAELAARSTAEALALHVRGMLEDSEPLPDPSPLDRVACNVEANEVARLLVGRTSVDPRRPDLFSWTE